MTTVWQVLSFFFCVPVAVGLAFWATDTLEPMFRSSNFAGFVAGAIFLGSIGMPTLILRWLHPRLPRALFLWYVCLLVTLVFVWAILNMHVEL